MTGDARSSALGGPLQRAIDAGRYDHAALRLAAGLLEAMASAPAAREQLLALLTPTARSSRPGQR